MRIRTTRGVNLNSMKAFTVVDDWTQAGNAHRVLDFPWVGNTVFFEACDSMTVIDESSDDQSKVRSQVSGISSIGMMNKSKRKAIQCTENGEMRFMVDIKDPSACCKRERDVCRNADAAFP